MWPIGSDAGMVNEVTRLSVRAVGRGGPPSGNTGFWIAALAARQIEICPTPQDAGGASIVRLRRGAVPEPERLPGAAIPVAAPLG